MNTARERLAKCFAAVFPELNSDEVQRASTLTVGSWDSVAAVTLVSTIEEEFGIEINPDALEELVSF
jgi:acyl carrier protein